MSYREVIIDNYHEVLIYNTWRKDYCLKGQML